MASYAWDICLEGLWPRNGMIGSMFREVLSETRENFGVYIMSSDTSCCTSGRAGFRVCE